MYSQGIVLGIIVSIIFSELVGLSPAGLIVPGYIALSLSSPGRVVYTLLIAAVTMGICRLLGHFIILYGRRQFALSVLIAFLLDAGISASGILPYSMSLIGCLVPGIIAREFDRQGIGKTLLALAVVTVILALIFELAGWNVLPVSGL